MRRLAPLLLVLPLLALASRAQGSQTIFEKSFERTSGAPQEYSETFFLPSEVGSPFKLTVSGPPNVSLTLNGAVLTGSLVEKLVALEPSNGLVVRLTGKKGSALVQITGEPFVSTPATRLLFPAEVFTRVPGAPEEQTRAFTVPPGIPGPFTLRVENGDSRGGFRVSAAQVKIDGAMILGPNRFSQQVGEIEEEVALTPGSHTLSVRLMSFPGSYLRVSLFQGAAQGGGISAVSGSGQSGIVHTALASPFVAKLADLQGRSVQGGSVYFRVSRGGGILENGDRRMIVATDSRGQAEATLRLGKMAGADMNEVEASSPGFGRVFFSAVALPGPAVRVYEYGGENQREEVGRELPDPIEVRAEDEAGNPVLGVQVTFSVSKGDGSFGGAPAVTAQTNAAGVCGTTFTLGSTPGLGEHQIQADFPGNVLRPLTFTFSAFVAGPPESTSVSGVVIDNADQPVESVTLKVEGTSLSTQSDEKGQFRISGVAPGRLKVLVDPSTVTRPGEWPDLSFNVYAIPGIDNPVKIPIQLVPLEEAPESRKVGGGLTAETYTLPSVPGFSITVHPRSTSIHGLKQPLELSVTQYPSNRMFVAPPGIVTPCFGCTMRPKDVRFDPPAQLTYPNLHSEPPGEIVNIYSLNYDTNVYDKVATATVSEDGALITTNPGEGLIRGSCGTPENPNCWSEVECPSGFVRNGDDCVCAPGRGQETCRPPCGLWNPGTCTCQPQDGAACSDGLLCTNDVCSGGTCVGTPRCPPGSTCDPNTGNCSSLCDPAARAACQPPCGTWSEQTCTCEPLDGAACEDGDLCTRGDSCIGGTCLSGTPRDCVQEYGAGAICNHGNGECECEQVTTTSGLLPSPDHPSPRQECMPKPNCNTDPTAACDYCFEECNSRGECVRKAEVKCEAQGCLTAGHCQSDPVSRAGKCVDQQPITCPPGGPDGTAGCFPEGHCVESGNTYACNWLLCPNPPKTLCNEQLDRCECPVPEYCRGFGILWDGVLCQCLCVSAECGDNKVQAPPPSCLCVCAPGMPPDPCPNPTRQEPNYDTCKCECKPCPGGLEEPDPRRDCECVSASCYQCCEDAFAGRVKLFVSGS